MMIGKMAPETNVDDAFAFTDKYITGIELVDEEHKHLLILSGTLMMLYMQNFFMINMMKS